MNELDLSDVAFISEAINAEMKRSVIETDDVLLNITGASIGRVARFYHRDTRANVNQHVCIIRPEKSHLDSRFLTYYLSSPEVQHDINNRHQHGGTRQALTFAQISEFEIPLPPLPEQKRIADILDKADAIRRKRQEVLDTLSVLRSSVFLRLFGDPRAQQTDWPEVSLGEVTVLDARMVDPRKAEYSDLIHLGPDRIEKNTGRLLPALTAGEEGLISSKFLFDERYLLYSKIRPYLRKVALPDFKGLCSADVYPIRPVEDKATREFLFALLISEAFLAYTTSLPSRASIPKLNRKELAAYTFHLPPIALQQQYTEILRSHEQATETFGKASDESEHLFNSLVQQAFKGEL
jgi:type I restriction enzyme S subunit